MSGRKFIVHSCKIEALSANANANASPHPNATATATWAFCKVPTATRRGRDSYINTGLPERQRLNVCNANSACSEWEQSEGSVRERVINEKWQSAVTIYHLPFTSFEILDKTLEIKVVTLKFRIILWLFSFWNLKNGRNDVKIIISMTFHILMEFKVFIYIVCLKISLISALFLPLN